MTPATPLPLEARKSSLFRVRSNESGLWNTFHTAGDAAELGGNARGNRRRSPSKTPIKSRQPAGLNVRCTAGGAV